MKIRRSLKIQHSQQVSEYTGNLQTEKLETLKASLRSQQSLLSKVNGQQDAATFESFRLAHVIARHGKSN